MSNKINILICSMLCVILPAKGWGKNEHTFEKILELGLPVVVLTTVNGEEPTCEPVWAPKDCMGQGIINANKVPGRVQIIDLGGTIYDSGDYEADESGMKLKVRGNSSAWGAKKPYKIKLQRKADLLIRGDDEKYSDREWLLVKDDQPSLNTIIGMKMNELMNMSWIPSYRLVNVMLNDDYRGVYLLMESVKRNNRCRLDVDKQTGYVFEYDPYWWNEQLYFDTPFTTTPGAKNAKFTFKEPDSEDVTEEQIDYLRNFLSQVEDSIRYGSHYEEMLDMESFVSWLLGQDILGNYDGHGSNMFVTKYDNTPLSKIKMALLWDFDAIMRTPSQWSNSHKVFYYEWLWAYQQPSFLNSYKQKWEEVKTTLFVDLIAHLAEIANSDYGMAYERSIEEDGKRWNREPMTLKELSENAFSWFGSRLIWLDETINAMTGISPLKSPPHRKATYSLNGYKIVSPQKGITIIRDGNGHTRKIMK